MGEIAEMMLDGTLCEGCGTFIDSTVPGYPRRCTLCRAEEANAKPRPSGGRERCPGCGKSFPTAQGLHDHMRMTGHKGR